MKALTEHFLKGNVPLRHLLNAKTSVYALTEICLHWSKGLGPSYIHALIYILTFFLLFSRHQFENKQLDTCNGNDIRFLVSILILCITPKKVSQPKKSSSKRDLDWRSSYLEEAHFSFFQHIVPNLLYHIYNHHPKGSLFYILGQGMEYWVTWSKYV